MTSKTCRRGKTKAITQAIMKHTRKQNIDFRLACAYVVQTLQLTIVYWARDRE